MNISSLSQEIVPIPVTLIDGCTCADLTSATVEIAFVTPGTKPGPGDWHTGAWDTSCGDCSPLAEILVGGSGVVLAVGTYQPWVRVTIAPEIAVEPSTGFVRIY